MQFIIIESDGTKNQIEKLKFDLNLNDLLMNNGFTNGEQINFDLGDFCFQEDGSIYVILSHYDPRPVLLLKVIFFAFLIIF